MAPRSDSELLSAARAGDPNAFEELYRAHRDWVLQLAWRWTADAQDAQDVVQETFLYVVRKLPELELTARFRTFLYPVVRHLARDARVRRGRHVTDELALESLAVSAAPDEPAAASQRADLARALVEVPAGQREVLLLRVADGLALEEIAALLDLPLGTVKSRLHHALARLRADPTTRERFSP